MAMTMTGEATLPAARPEVWAMLNDPAVLKDCIPGCQSLERTGDNGFAAVAKVKIGPVAATFKGKVELSDIVPEVGYTIAGEGEGGVAGFAKGSARTCRLPTPDAGTQLRYDVEAHVGGKIAQLGSRLIDGVAKNMADKFFASFAEAAAARAASGQPPEHRREPVAASGRARRAAADRARAGHPRPKCPSLRRRRWGPLPAAGGVTANKEVLVQEDMGMVHVSMTVNGRQVSAEVDPRTLLSQFLRENLRLTGTHVGCDTSQCGACVVHVDGEAIKSCTTLAASCAGANVTTIEGLAHDGKLHPMQQAFQDNHGLQCGFCTPGMIMAAIDLVNREGRESRRGCDPPRARGQHLPLHRLPQHRQVGRPGRARNGRRGDAEGRRVKPVSAVPRERDIMSATGIGASVKRKEDIRFITGKGHYVDDINRPGQAYAFFVRSPHAHATIDKIDASAALKSKGVVAVLTGADAVADKIGAHIGGVDGPFQGRFADEGRARFRRWRTARRSMSAILSPSSSPTPTREARDAAEKVVVDYGVLPRGRRSRRARQSRVSRKCTTSRPTTRCSTGTSATRPRPTRRSPRRARDEARSRQQPHDSQRDGAARGARRL